MIKLVWGETVRGKLPLGLVLNGEATITKDLKVRQKEQSQSWRHVVEESANFKSFKMGWKAVLIFFFWTNWRWDEILFIQNNLFETTYVSAIYHLQVLKEYDQFFWIDISFINLLGILYKYADFKVSFNLMPFVGITS